MARHPGLAENYIQSPAIDIYRFYYMLHKITKFYVIYADIEYNFCGFDYMKIYLTEIFEILP